ncbi:hypothetical protein BJ742DRAFT_868823 [Cladochytrium replicatum]|nr:hypothetical protein BJ742DRAFT_868823 [Cladochytrium replicatum]
MFSLVSECVGFPVHLHRRALSRQSARAAFRNPSKIVIDIGSIPVKPMHGKITQSVAEVFEKVPGQEFCVIHFPYRSEGVPTAFYGFDPEVVEPISSPDGHQRKSTGTAMEFIVGGEIVAVDAEGNVQPFQVLSTRKLDAGGNAFAHEDQPGVYVKVFDLMIVPACDLYAKRLELLHTQLSEVLGKFTFVPQFRSREEKDVADFLSQGIKTTSCGGLDAQASP